ncbi:His-Xaa-Ser system radical SAM maturase HxsB [Paludisphaera soli]|uniref:His-Xaa-Ser system radical SAM maturase HxsB n=1 Tax=Paludisphaera soli TaxID=2712865 RepID=UPI0013EB10B7|nr:His-Xaa-Ser system radical SAM maturase HxsB [Paludisphaera soli]
MPTALPVLNDRFRPVERFAARPGRDYTLLPMRLISLDAGRHVLTNFAGEYVVLPKETTRRLVRHELDTASDVFEELLSRHFVSVGGSDAALDLLAVKYRTKQSLLAEFTSLFMFVVSLRCDHSCPYCQVSRQSLDRHAYDMKPDVADRAVDFMFRSPSRALKVEFQGGESLLNFPLIRRIVERVESRNLAEGRDVQFVIATNLAPLTDEMLDYCRVHEIVISTSLDGPRELHNQNRPRPGGDSHKLAVRGIRRVREALGHDSVAALMTTTAASLAQPREIVDEYVRQGFSCVFLRPLSPYGFAVKTGLARKYAADEWLEFYRAALGYIIELNLAGTPFREEYSSLILRKMLTPFPTGYVDLQSPAGLGIAGLIFNYDGDVYASDEARMLAETGDRKFRLGNLAVDSFEDVMTSDALIDVLSETMTEGVPMCVDCGFQPYCGSDPVYHHATQGDVVGFKPTSDFCRRNMGVMRHLVRLLEDDERAASVLETWI